MPLLDLRKQIASTISTKAITKAMQLVAANKMKAFVKEAVAARNYAVALEAGYQQVKSAGGHEPRLTSENGTTLFFLFTSDKGLCGALNTRVVKALVQSEVWKNTPESERTVIVFGQKGFDLARRLKITVERSILKAPEKLHAQLAWKLFGDMFDKILDNNIKAAYAAHSVYQSAFAFGTEVTKLTRDIYSDQPTAINPQAAQAIIEPSATKYLKRVEKRLITARLIACVAELKATEYSSRMMAMQKATDAATEKIATLTNAYHKARQAMITQELAELSAAGEAMNSPYGHEISLLRV